MAGLAVPGRGGEKDQDASMGALKYVAGTCEQGLGEPRGLHGL